MALTTSYERVDLLPIVKAYPNLSRQYGEVSCIAALTLGGLDRPEWLRLYPVPFRTLDEGRQFTKYQPISARIATHSGDSRPESRRVDADSIEPAGAPMDTRDGWRARRAVVEPVMDDSMCGIQARQRDQGQSLGMFRPAEVDDVVIEAVEKDPRKSEDADAWAAQGSLLDAGADRTSERKALEQIPFRFKYRYRCAHPACNGHEQSIVDWEVAQFFRRIRHAGNWRELLREKWVGELCAPSRDTAFIVGDQHQHPGGFLVLGVWYPPKQDQQLGLGDLSDV